MSFSSLKICQLSSPVQESFTEDLCPALRRRESQGLTPRLQIQQRESCRCHKNQQSQNRVRKTVHRIVEQNEYANTQTHR